MRASILAVALLAMQPAAAPVTFVADFDLAFSGSPEIPAGLYEAAACWTFPTGAVAERGPGLVSWHQMREFRVELLPFSMNLANLRSGTCLSRNRMPWCGLWFDDGVFQGIVGQFSIPEGRWNLRLQNTNSNRFEPGPLFQSVTIEDLDVGFTVVSGFLHVRRAHGGEHCR